MMHAKSESDSTSLTPSSPRSPKRPVYYVQSPSRDSHDGDKSSTTHATPAYNSPMDSPYHPSIFGHQPRASSASRVSGTFKSSSGRKPNRKRNEKGWTECNVIEEEGDYDDFYGDGGFTRRCQYLIALMGFVLLFTLLCLIIWGASRPHRVRVAVKGLTINNFYFGVGSDWTGVPTKLLTSNCSVKMILDNPATFFGIHVSSTPVNLIYAEITVATGQLKKYYQPRKSRRIVTVNLKGDKVPLYGAGESLTTSDNNGGVPLKLEFRICSRGNVVGKLVKTRHRIHISCSLAIESSNTEVIKFRKDSCTYD